MLASIIQFQIDENTFSCCEIIRELNDFYLRHKVWYKEGSSIYCTPETE